MQPVDEEKLGSADEEGDSGHHGVAKGGAEGDHNEPDAQIGCATLSKFFLPIIENDLYYT
jgi:hypothetical protein